MLASEAPTPPQAEPGVIGRQVGRLAVRSLYRELALDPKPGLVTPLDNGSHRDMDAGTFLRSLFALRGYFAQIATAGAANAEFERLRHLGVQAERRMLGATGGVNTHRGAVFTLGLLAAAAGHRLARGLRPTPEAVGATVRAQWGHPILAAAPRAVPATASHGLRACRRYRVGGAREQAAQGFPAVFETGLPALRWALERGADEREALIHALFSLMAEVDDTNVLHRGGQAGLRVVQSQSRSFLAAGSVLAPDWQRYARGLARAWVVRWLSPGGSADLLAATCFVHWLDRD